MEKGIKLEANINFDLKDPRAVEQVKEFASKNFVLLQGTLDSKNPSKFYFCCQAFMTRKMDKLDHHHDRSDFILYSWIKNVYKVECEDSFAAALLSILKEMAAQGKPIRCPSINTPHSVPKV